MGREEAGEKCGNVCGGVRGSGPQTAPQPSADRSGGGVGGLVGPYDFIQHENHMSHEGLPLYHCRAVGLSRAECTPLGWECTCLNMHPANELVH